MEGEREIEEGARSTHSAPSISLSDKVVVSIMIMRCFPSNMRHILPTIEFPLPRTRNESRFPEKPQFAVTVSHLRVSGVAFQIENNKAESGVAS